LIRAAWLFWRWVRAPQQGVPLTPVGDSVAISVAFAGIFISKVVEVQDNEVTEDFRLLCAPFSWLKIMPEPV